MIEAEAEQVGAPLFRCGVEWDAFASQGRLLVHTASRALDLSLPALNGAHQIENAGLACAALMHWRSDLTDDAFERGVSNAKLPARLQALTRGPLSAPVRALGGEVWVDGGHNAHATAALVRWSTSRQTSRSAPLVVIFGSRARKDWAMSLKPLAAMADLVIASSLSEGVDPALIASLARSQGAASVAAASLEEAMQKAAQLPAPRVLICGSFLLAAQALALENA